MRPRRGVSELSLLRQSVLIAICSLEVDVGRNLDVLHACLEALAAGRLKTQVSCESELSTHTLLGSDPIFSVDCPVYSFTRRHFALLSFMPGTFGSFRAKQSPTLFCCTPRSPMHSSQDV